MCNNNNNNNNNNNKVPYQLFAVTGLAHQMRARRGGMVNRRAPHGHVGQRLRDNSDNRNNSDNRENASGSRRG